PQPAAAGPAGVPGPAREDARGDGRLPRGPGEEAGRRTGGRRGGGERARLKLAFVVQRYGLDIAGGAEYHCRLVAEHLARHAEVEVFTTCAADYVTWANRYPEGREVLNGIPVRRFKVKRPRDPEAFADWTDRVFRASHAPADELRWLEGRGPFSPRLVRHVERQRDAFDLFVFFSYRYYPTYHGLFAVRDKAL